MSRSGEEFGGLTRQRSSWVFPLVVFFVTACLSAIVLAYYFAPGPPGLGEELPSPTDATRPVTLTVGSQGFRIPANYVMLSSSRRGGAREAVMLAAMLPSFQGYSLDAAGAFSGNAADSPIITITVKSTKIPVTEQDRLDRVYLMQVVDSAGETAPFGLRHYIFRPESGYHAEELFVGSADNSTIVLLCDRPGVDTTSPNCLRELPLGDGLALSYRFKRAQLAQWRALDSGVRMLIDRFALKN